MIVDEKLWEDQEDFENAHDFLKEHKFDLIVSGDNHRFLTDNISNRWIINCGSMLRSTIDQIKHTPTIMLFDTQTAILSEIKIPIKSAEEVFKMEQVIKAKERNDKMEAFVEKLSNDFVKDMGLSFGDNLDIYMKANRIDDSIKTIIRENMI
jgi:hypothetical protein